MITAELLFKIKIGWQQTVYDALYKIATYHKWENKEGVWVFKYVDLRQVESILGQTIEVPGLRDKFETEKVKVPKFKGVDFVEIIEYPKIYQIVEHRKVERKEDGEIKYINKELRHNLPKELVDKVWNDVIVHQPLNKPIKSSTIAEKICKALEIDRFNRETGSFDWAKFFGNRSQYYKYFYLPIKVLVWKGKIIHHKHGTIERISQPQSI